MIRSLREIEKDIAKAKDMLSLLRGEIEDFQSHCPHSEEFLEVKQSDVEDEAGGPAIYEYTHISYTCKLCNGVFHGSYNKNREKRPTLDDILAKDDQK